MIHSITGHFLLHVFISPGNISRDTIVLAEVLQTSLALFKMVIQFFLVSQVSCPFECYGIQERARRFLYFLKLELYINVRIFG